MKTATPVFVLSVLFLSLAAHAETYPRLPANFQLLADTGRTTSDGRPIVDDAVLSSSSEALREGKTWDIVVEPIGFSVAPVVSLGVTVGYYLRPDMVAELNYAHGSAKFLFFEIFSDVLSLRLKKYWGNSFYTNSGLAIRTLGGRFTDEDLFNNNNSDFDDGEVSATSLVIDFAIGNKWQFDNFTIGCDWIGFMVPISTLSTKDDFPENNIDEDDLDDKDEMEKLSKQGTAQLLRFYLGAAF